MPEASQPLPADSEPERLFREGRAASTRKPPDDAGAMELFAQAASAGHAGAMSAIGWMILGGRSGPVDGTGAEGWLRRAADAGDLEALYKLAHIYLDGEGVAKNEGTGLTLLLEGAEAGHLESMFAAAWALRDGCGGIVADPSQILYWLRRAAEGGHPGAMVELAHTLNDDDSFLDEEEIAQWFRRAAEAGEPEGMFQWGIALMRGEGTPLDAAQGRLWLNRAMMRDHRYTRRALTELVMVTAPNPDTALETLRFFRDSAEMGHPVGMYALAMLYLNGDLIPANREEGMEWLKRAAKAGSLDAQDELAIRDAAWQ